MAALVCDICGGKLIMSAGGIAVCESCGMEHSANRMKEKVQEIKGTVRVDNSHMVENYLEMARTAKDVGNNAEAEVYCNKIIEIDPKNYKAWMLKGKAAAWQSSLQNSRIDEGVAAFLKGINNAPEEVKGSLIEETKTQIQKLSVAMISLRADRFAKWPDKEETTGLFSDMEAIANTMRLFIAGTHTPIFVSEVMAPAAKLMYQAAVKAYNSVVLPEYKSERYPWPDDDDFRKYIVRIDCCLNVINGAITSCKIDDEENIQRYESMITLQKEAIKGCSFVSQYVDLSERWVEDLYRNRGMYPVYSENRVYCKNLSLNDSAVASRRQLISQYEDKIREIKAAKERKEAAEKLQKEMLAREEAKKRFDSYWTEHAGEKVNLEAEREELNSQIAALNTSLNDQISAFNSDIAAIPGKAEISDIEARIGKLTAGKNALGLFKVKEKRAIQEQIDRANAEKKGIQERIDAARREIESKIESVKADFQKKISPLQNRIETISDELTKGR